MFSGMFIGQCGVVGWRQRKGRKPLKSIKNISYPKKGGKVAV